MIYQAKVLRIDEPVEGEVVLQIGNIKLTCFAYSRPGGIDAGYSYPVGLSLEVFGDDFSLEEAPDDTEPSIIRLGETFAYVITGRLNGCYLNAGELTFEDNYLFSEYGYIDGKTVTVKVDRIDADFDPET